MKHLSAFFRPVTNALSAWSVGLHSFFSHLLISAGSLPQRNVSVTSASAAIVGTPSRRRRGLMLKPLALMLLFLLGSVNVWGDSFSLTNSTISSNKTGKTSYGNYSIGTEWGGKWMISSSGATYFLQLGYNTNSTKSAYNSHLAINLPSGANNISIAIETNNSTASGRTFYACNANNKGYVNSGNGDYGSAATSVANGTATISITGSPTVVYIYPNGTAYIASVTVTYSAGGSSNPAISVQPVGAKYVVGDAAAALTITAAPHTSGKTLSYQWYSNTINSTEDATVVGTNSNSYTPAVTSAGTTYYYCVVSEQDGGNANSNIVSVEVKDASTIAGIMPTTSSEGAEFALNDVTVTYANGKNIYVKDASGYMLVYDNNSAISGAANGKVLHGLWGKAKLYNGHPEISTVTQAPTVADGSAVEPEDLDAYPTDADLNKYVTLEGVTFASAQTLSTTGSVENITGSFKSSNLTIRNNFKIAASLAAGTSYRVVGVVQKYNTTIQLYPISFEEQADPTVTLSPAALDFGTIGVGDAAPTAQTFIVSGSNLTENLTASVTAGSEYYDIAVTDGSLNQDGGTVSATITVTPKSAISANAGTKAGTVTVSGSGLSETVSLSAEVKAKHTVTWNNNGTPSTTQVIDGEKPSFPVTPASCDATSTTFVGWATAPWDDKIDDLAGKTVHTSNATMDAVTTDDIVYYAVFAKSAGGAFDGTTGGEFYIYADIDDTKYYAKAFASKIESTTDIAEAVKYTLERKVENEKTYFAIKSNDKYLGYGTSGTDFSYTLEEAYYFEIASGEHGSWRLKVTTGNTARSIVYRTGTTNKFAPYAVSGINGTEYYDIEIGSGASMSDYMTTCCEKHSITIDSEIANGNVVADKDEACEGKKVTLTPTADPAYHFYSWDVYKTGEPATKITVTANKFDMPAYDVTVSASFEHDPCTNLSAPTLNGDIAVTYNSATINWNSVAHAVSYDVVIVRHSDSEPIFSGNVTATDKALTGLDPETQYDYSIMGVGDGSDYCTSGNNTLEGNFTTGALPEVQLWLVKKQGAAAVDGGKHALGVEFDITPSDLSCTKTFVGWTDAANKDYTHATDAPSVLINKYTFTSEDAVTLYAVYAEVTPGATTYTLTPAASMSEGTYVIAAYDENYKALTGTVSSGKLVNETTGSAIDGEGKLVSLPTDACEFTFTAVTGGYSIQKPNDDYLGYTSTSDNNKLAFGDYSSLVWSVNANAKEGSPVNGVSLTTSAYKVSANASAGSDTWVRGYKSSGSIYQPIYLFKKAAGASTTTNYATTCADAPEATPSPTSVEAVAAGASGTITMSYENVNTSALDVALCNDAAGEEAFTGDWLSASLSSTNISYTVNPNTTYEARTAYIKLTAPETTGATDPAVVIIPVTQAKYIPEFASLADLVAADLASGTEVTVSFSNILITEIYATSSGDRKGVYLDVTAANNEDIEIFYASSPYVPSAWVKNGYLSATNLVATWTHYTQYGNDVWELIPVGDFSWETNLTYAEPQAVSSVVVTGTPSKTSYKTGQAFEPAGLTVTVTYNDNSHATVAAADCDWEIAPSTFTEAGTNKSVSVKATYNEVQSLAFVVENLTVTAAPTFNASDHEWQLVTSEAQLVAGKYYVIASTAQDKVMSNTITKTNSANYAGEVSATFADGVIAYNAFGSSKSADAAGVAVLQLGGEADAWTLTEVVANDALLGATAAKYLAWGNGMTTWSISIASDDATIQNGTNTYGRILHNVNSTRFTTYTSDVSASMLLPQLYVWAEKVYKLRYDANGGEDAPAAQVADGEGKATVTDAKPTKEDYIFKEWNTLVGGDGESKAAGDVIDLSAGDVTLYAQWRDPVTTVTISYDANEGSGLMDADENQTEGSTYTIKDNEFTRDGYLFAGWKAYDINDDELTITNGKFTVPATNVTVKAQWQSATDSKWVLVEHLSQLANGDKVIIAAANYGYALGAASGSVRTNVAVTKTGKLLSVPGSATVLILGRNGNDFTFKDDTEYLNWTSGNNLTTSDEVNNNSTWNITIENNATTIANKATAERKIQYNAQSPRFAAYTGSQQAVVIYKYLDMDPTDETSGYERTDLILSGIGTICLPYDVKASDRFGGVFYMPSHQTSGFANFIEETGTLRAGKAYIFVAENEFIRLKYSGDEPLVAPLSNVADTRGLIGTFTGIAAGGLTGKYVIADNKLRKCGSGAYLNAYRAYLDLDEMPEEELTINEPANAPARRRLGIGGGASGVTTDIEDVQGNSLSGIKVLLNGQLFIIRGEKMYDATGRLVK